MTISRFDYPKSPFNSDSFKAELAASDISVALDHIDTVGSGVSIYFKAELSLGEVDILDELIANHSGAASSVQDLPTDSERSPILRVKTTRTGWHFEPRPIGFSTCKAGSLYNRNSDGSSIGDAVLRFFDAGGSELVKGGEEAGEAFQARLDASCVLTAMDWEPVYSVDLIGALLQAKAVADDAGYLWVIVAPDIPSQLGGSVPLLNGGYDLSFLREKSPLDMDGKGVKTFNYDPVHHTGKIRALVRHPAGSKTALQLIFKHYRG